jgi:hypothetical protein
MGISDSKNKYSRTAGRDGSREESYIRAEKERIRDITIQNITVSFNIDFYLTSS